MGKLNTVGSPMHYGYFVVLGLCVLMGNPIASNAQTSPQTNAQTTTQNPRSKTQRQTNQPL